MRNQPKYNFFKNSNYAIEGLKDIVKNETSFKIELILAIILLPIIVFIEVPIIHKLLLFISLMGVLIAETINSAIERAVDLTTLEQHQLAKRAKDCGSSIVFLAILLFLVVWLVIFYYNFFGK